MYIKLSLTQVEIHKAKNALKTKPVGLCNNTASHWVFAKKLQQTRVEVGFAITPNIHVL